MSFSTSSCRPAQATAAGGTSLSSPKSWLNMYDGFITKNAGQVSQIESGLRSLSYIIPGRFRDAEIASETVHTGVQLLSLYHDSLLRRVSLTPVSSTPISTSGSPPASPAPRRAGPLPNPHTRYTRFWTAKSALYRRIALLLQMVKYTELLFEMAAKRRGGERTRWRVVVLLEGIKALCKLILLRVTRARPLLNPALPERENIPPPPGSEEEDDDAAGTKALSELLGEDISAEWGPVSSNTTPSHQKPWLMPRTGMSLPSLPNPGDISSYLLGRVLTADDIKPASKLVSPTTTPAAAAAEVLHILAPLAYAVLLARAKDKRSWHPWAVGLLMELAARQLRERGLRTSRLERDEWTRRGWGLGWWAMRGAFYEHVTKGIVGRVRGKMPRLIGGIMEDYEYLWENYYFSTASS